jgi:hypothetical protein
VLVDAQIANTQDTKPEEVDASAGPKPATSTTPKRQKPTEPNQFSVKNLTRVTHTQFPFLSFNGTDRYDPVRPIGESLVKDKKTSPFNCGNVVVLRNKAEDAAEGAFVELDEFLWTGVRPQPQAVVAPAPASI